MQNAPSVEYILCVCVLIHETLMMMMSVRWYAD